MGSLSTSELGILAAATGGCALILTVIFGFILLPVLRHFKLGQPIRTEGPIWHQPKAGTPTMAASALFWRSCWQRRATPCSAPSAVRGGV